MTEEWIAARQQGWREDTAYFWAAVARAQVAGSATVSAVNRTHDTGWFLFRLELGHL